MRYRNGQMGDAYIRVSNLEKSYRSGDGLLTIFSGLNLEVERGEMLALVGESGAGKSTLLHLLGGLDSPSSGTIYYGGREISGLAEAGRADFRNREIGFVWQIHYLLPEFSAVENVMMPLLIRACRESSPRANRWRGWMRLGLARGRLTAPGNYREASNSAWCWLVPWWANLPRFSPMNPRGTSTFGPPR